MLAGHETALLEDAVVGIAAPPRGHLGDARLEEDAVSAFRGPQRHALAGREDDAGDVEANDGGVALDEDAGAAHERVCGVERDGSHGEQQFAGTRYRRGPALHLERLALGYRHCCEMGAHSCSKVRVRVRRCLVMEYVVDLTASLLLLGD